MEQQEPNEQLTPPRYWALTPEGMSYGGDLAVENYHIGFDLAGKTLVVRQLDGGDRWATPVRPDDVEEGRFEETARAFLLDCGVSLNGGDVENGGKLLLADLNGLVWKVHAPRLGEEPSGLAGQTVGEIYRQYQEEMARVADEAAEIVHDAEAEGRLKPVNLGEIMREGAKPPEMLVPKRIVQGALHWLYGPPGSMKTMLALQDAKYVMEGGSTVVWVDEEVGRQDIANRLIGLGASPEMVEARLRYFEMPGLAISNEDVAAWLAALEIHPALVVFDTATDVLAAADLDENRMVEVTRWIKTFCEPARLLGAAVVVLDHTPHDGSGDRPINSMAKKAKAKIMLSLKVEDEGGRDKIGRVKVTRTKNGLAAPIPEEQWLRMGGDGEGGIVVEEIEVPYPDETAKTKRAQRIEAKVKAAVEKHRLLSQRQLEAFVGGRAAEVRKVAQELAAAEITPVRMRPSKNRSLEFYWHEEESK